MITSIFWHSVCARQKRRIRIVFSLPGPIGQAPEPVLVQALGTEQPVERLDQPIILRGLSRPAEVQSNTVEIRPQVDPLAREIAPVINPDLLRQDDSIQHPGHIVAVEPLVHPDRQTLACDVIATLVSTAAVQRLTTTP